MGMFETLLKVPEADRDEFFRQFDEDPYRFYAMMREMGPVILDPVLGIYHVVRCDEIEDVLKNPAVFSSAVNAQLTVDYFGRNMLHLDGEDHTRLRGLVNASFTPAAIAGYAGHIIAPICDAIIDSLRGRKTVELCGDFCLRYPLTIIARMLNIPMSEFKRFQGWYQAIVAAMTEYPQIGEKHALGIVAARELSEFLRPVVRENMARPLPTSLLGHMALTRLEGERLTEDEIVSFTKQLLFAGAETTQRLIATVIYGILSTGARDRVRGDESLVESAIEEGLRWNSPAQTVVRNTTEDTVLAGVPIPKGAIVAVQMAAAHRDPARYEDPDVFKADRRPKHFAFGGGRHMCLGAYLARAEAKIALLKFFDAFPSVELDPRHEVRFGGLGMRSPVALHLLLEGAEPNAHHRPRAPFVEAR